MFVNKGMITAASKEVAIERAASTATIAGGGSAVVFGLSMNEFAAAIGAMVAIVGLIVQVWFKHQHLKLAKQVAESNPQCATCPDRVRE